MVRDKRNVLKKDVVAFILKTERPDFLAADSNDLPAVRIKLLAEMSFPPRLFLTPYLGNRLPERRAMGAVEKTVIIGCCSPETHILRPFVPSLESRHRAPVDRARYLHLRQPNFF